MMIVWMYLYFYLYMFFFSCMDIIHHLFGKTVWLICSLKNYGYRFAMHELGLSSRKPFKKCARVVGEVKFWLWCSVSLYLRQCICFLFLKILLLRFVLLSIIVCIIWWLKFVVPFIVGSRKISPAWRLCCLRFLSANGTGKLGL